MIQETTDEVDEKVVREIWKPDYLQKWIEGYALLVVIIVGSTANLFSLIIIRNKELNLIRDFSRLLQSQAAYDVCYLIVNVVTFVIPALNHKMTESILPVLQFSPTILQFCLTGSFYTTIALAFERLNAMKLRPLAPAGRSSPLKTYPTNSVMIFIFIMALIYNFPRFFDTQYTSVPTKFVKRISNFNQTRQDSVSDFRIMTYNVSNLIPSPYLGKNINYVIYYKMVSAFLVLVAVPLTSLLILNFLVWHRLQHFKAVATRFGRQQRKTIRATISLIAIIVLFMVCNSIKVVVDGYRVVQVLEFRWGNCTKNDGYMSNHYPVNPGKDYQDSVDVTNIDDTDNTDNSFCKTVDNIPNTWPTWVNNLTFFSHLLLAINASVNLLLYCFCDKHFWVITQKTLKMYFIWPFTMRNRDANSASEQTGGVHNRRPTQIMHADPQTEIKDLSRRGSHMNRSNRSTPTPPSPSCRSFWSLNFKRSMSGSGSAANSPPSDKSSQRLSKKPSLQVKLPLSFGGIHTHDSNSSGDVAKIAGGTSTQNGVLLNKSNHVDNSKENNYVEIPLKNAQHRVECIKMETIRKVVEVNGNIKESMNIDTVPNNVFSSEP